MTEGRKDSGRWLHIDDKLPQFPGFSVPRT